MTNPEVRLIIGRIYNDYYQIVKDELEQAKTEIPDLDPGALQLFLDVRDTPPIVEKGGINPGLYLPEFDATLKTLRANGQDTDLPTILLTAAFRVEQERNEQPPNRVTNRGILLAFIAETISDLSIYLRDKTCTLDPKKAY